MDRKHEIESFKLLGEGERIALEANRLMKEAGLNTYLSILTILNSCVFEPSKSMTLEEQAELHTFLILFVEEQEEVLTDMTVDGDISSI